MGFEGFQGSWINFSRSNSQICNWKRKEDHFYLFFFSLHLQKKKKKHVDDDDYYEKLNKWKGKHFKSEEMLFKQILSMNWAIWQTIGLDEVKSSWKVKKCLIYTFGRFALICNSNFFKQDWTRKDWSRPLWIEHDRESSVLFGCSTQSI